LLVVIIVAVVLAWLSLFSCLEVVYESDKLLLSCFCTCVKLYLSRNQVSLASSDSMKVVDSPNSELCSLFFSCLQGILFGMFLLFTVTRQSPE